MSAISEFIDIVDSVYGVYMDAESGFLKVSKQVERNLKETKEHIERNKHKIPENVNTDNPEFLFCYSRLEPKQKITAKIHLHQATFEDVIKRNSFNGENFRFIANMVIVSIYQYWEDHYRKNIAKEIGLNSGNDLKAPIFGDLRKIRRSIIHNNGIAIDEIKNMEILDYIKPKEKIYFNKLQIEAILDYILLFLEECKKA